MKAFMNWIENMLGRHAGREESLRFRCNLCGRMSTAPLTTLTREVSSCKCGSTLRQRALIHTLSENLFGASLSLTDFPFRPDIVGIDMSGATVYADRLSKILGFTNTFLHKEPKLDITDPNSKWMGQCDFVLSSDVFEHVPPPISIAFDNVLQLLKPGGLFVLTVPYTQDLATVEHFPDLYDYQLIIRNGKRLLCNNTIDKRHQEFDNLVFHGGEGETLEMRIFSETGVLENLCAAGFTDVRIHDETYLEYGVIWKQKWSLPISARRAV